MKRWRSKLESISEILLLGVFLAALAFFTILFTDNPYIGEVFDNRFAKQFIVSWITRHLTSDGVLLIPGMVVLACASLAAFHMVTQGYRNRWQSVLYVLSTVFVLSVGFAWYNSQRTYHVAIQPFSILLGVSIANALRLFLFLMPNGRLNRWGLPLSLLAITLFPTIAAIYLRLGKTDVYADGIKRASGFWSDPNIFGALLSMSLLVWIGLGAALAHQACREEFRRFQKVLAWSALIIAILVVSKLTFALIATSSRSAIVGSFFGVLALCGLFKWHPSLQGPGSRRILIGIVTLFPLIAAGSWFVQPAQVEAVTTRFAKPVKVGDASVGNRFHALHGAIRMIIDGRIEGYSWSSRVEIYAKEYKSPAIADAGAFSLNDFLQVTLACGILGLLCLLAMVSIALLSPLPNPQEGSWKTVVLQWGCRAAILSGLVCAWFNRVLASPDTAVLFWVIFFVGMSMHVDEETKAWKNELSQKALPV